jgi:long-chain acyl-CoA synthetase
LIHVTQTFQSHAILLTGGNGFLGKVVLAYLLDRFPDLRRLYLLIRPKWDLSAEERFYRETLSSPPLAAIARQRGESWLREKITVLPGDVGSPDCGLSEEDLRRLEGEPGAIVNCAGLVDFFPPVDESFRANVEGVRHLASLARRLGAKLAHVSTCFVCGEGDGLVEETEPIIGFYPRRQGPDDDRFDSEREIAYCQECITRIDRTTPDASQRLIELGRQRAEHWGWTNTYTYAKSLGEQILAGSRDLEWTLIRPAIIEAALRFPFPGWVEGGRTAAPLVLMARGGLRDWPVRRDAPLDVVPVDLVAAAILTVTALLLHGEQESVYQLGTADVNPVYLEPLVELLAGEAHFLTPEEARARRQRLQQRLARAQSALNGVRGVLESARVPGRGRLSAWSLALRTRSLQATLREQTLDQYLPFIHHNRYIFETANIRAAYSKIADQDRARLPWDPENIDWRRYWIENEVEGIEKWIQPEAVKQWAFQI